MKRISFLLLFTLSFFVQAFAQEAFYIYRNDNDFDGFFYDQVQSIGYSKTAVDGTEFDAYVVMEILTADSLYRIPLEFIDSISFVQPEIKFNPKLRNMDNEDMLPYLVGRDGLKLIFSPDLPADIQPHKDDVLVSFDYDKFEEGYAGRVTSTAADGGNFVVYCDSLQDWGDLFEQFVSVEELQFDEGGSVTRRRVAGLNTIRHRADNNWNVERYPKNWSFDIHLPFLFNTDKSECHGTFNGHFGMGMTYKAACDIRPLLSKTYINVTAEESVEYSASVTFGGKIKGVEGNPMENTWAGAFTKLGFPTVLPVLQINVAPSFVLRGEASFSVTIGYGVQKTRLNQHLLYANGELKSDFVAKTPSEKEYESKDDWIFTADLNGYLQIGLQVPFEVSTAAHVSNIFMYKMGLYAYIGPKISGSLSVDLVTMKRTGGFYNLMKDTKLNFTGVAVDWEFKRTNQFWGGKEQEKVYADGGFGFFSYDFWAVPAFSDVSATPVDGSKTRIKAFCHPQRNVVPIWYLGFGIYDMKDNLIQSWYKEDESYNLFNTYAKLEHEFDIKNSGKYRLRPIMRHMGTSYNIPYMPGEEDEVEFTIDNSKLETDPEALIANKIGGMRQIVIDSDLDHFELSAEVDWLTFYTDKSQAKTRGISFDPLPDGEIERNATLSIVGYSADETYRKILLVPVTQNIIGSNEPALSTDPTHLEFEAPSDTKDVTLLTNCSDAKVVKADSWIQATISKGKVSVHVSANPSIDDRKGTIHLSGTKEGKTTQFELSVLQEGVLALSKHRVEYTPEGGNDEVTVRATGFQIQVECMDDWYTATLDGGRLTITCEENWTVGLREGEVVLKVVVDGVEVSTSIVVVQDAYIVCEPSELKNVGAWGTIEDVQIVSTKLKNLSIDAVCDWVGIGMMTGGSTITITVDENESEKAREGAATISGYKGSTKYTLKFPVSQKAGGDLQLPFELLKDDVIVSPEGKNGSLLYHGSADGVVATCNRSWIKNIRFSASSPEYGFLQFDALPNPDEWNGREGTIQLTKQMSKDEIYHVEVTVIQQALADVEPRIWASYSGHTLSYDPEHPDTIDVGFSYLDNISVRDNAGWLDTKLIAGDKQLVIDPYINKTDQERSATVTLYGRNRYGKEAKYEFTVTQGKYAGRNIFHTLEGVCVGIESAEEGAAFTGYNNFPYATGVYGYCDASGNFEVTNTILPDCTISVHVNYTGKDGAKTTATFYVATRKADNYSGWEYVINGQFLYEYESNGNNGYNVKKRLSLNVHDMPSRGLSLPYPYHSGWFDRTAWGGEGGYDIVEGGYGENGWITSFSYVTATTSIDPETNLPWTQTTTLTDKRKICVYLFDPHTTNQYERFPVGHPQRKTGD